MMLSVREGRDVIDDIVIVDQRVREIEMCRGSEVEEVRFSRELCSGYSQRRRRWEKVCRS